MWRRRRLPLLAGGVRRGGRPWQCHLAAVHARHVLQPLGQLIVAKRLADSCSLRAQPGGQLICGLARPGPGRQGRSARGRDAEGALTWEPDSTLGRLGRRMGGLRLAVCLRRSVRTW